MANPFACTYRPDYPPSEEDWLRSMKTIRSFNIEPYPAPAAFYALQQHQKHSHTEDSPQGLPDHTVCVECTVEACHCDLVVACRLCRALSHPVCLQGRLLKQIRAGKRPRCKICTLPFGIQFMINYIGSDSMEQCPSIRQEQEEARIRRAEDFVDAIVEVIHAGKKKEFDCTCHHYTRYRISGLEVPRLDMRYKRRAVGVYKTDQLTKMANENVEERSGMDLEY